MPHNSALCRFHTIMTIWNYLQYPPPPVCRLIKNAKNFHRSTNDGLHKYTCANVQLLLPPQSFRYDRMYPGQNMDQVCYIRYPTTTSCCFGFLILTMQTYKKWIQRLHNSTDMFSTDVRVIRMFALSVRTRLLQRWNTAYVTRHVLGNKHITTSFRYPPSHKLLESKNVTQPTVFLHIITFQRSTSLTAHSDTYWHGLLKATITQHISTQKHRHASHLCSQITTSC